MGPARARVHALQKSLEAEHRVGTEQENMGLVVLSFGTQMDSSTQAHAHAYKDDFTKHTFEQGHLLGLWFCSNWSNTFIIINVQNQDTDSKVVTHNNRCKQALQHSASVFLFK